MSPRSGTDSVGRAGVALLWATAMSCSNGPDQIFVTTDPSVETVTLIEADRSRLTALPRDSSGLFFSAPLLANPVRWVTLHFESTQELGLEVGANDAAPAEGRCLWEPLAEADQALLLEQGDDGPELVSFAPERVPTFRVESEECPCERLDLEQTISLTGDARIVFQIGDDRVGVAATDGLWTFDLAQDALIEHPFQPLPIPASFSAAAVDGEEVFLATTGGAIHVARWTRTPTVSASPVVRLPRPGFVHSMAFVRDRNGERGLLVAAGHGDDTAGSLTLVNGIGTAAQTAELLIDQGPPTSPEEVTTLVPIGDERYLVRLRLRGETYLVDQLQVETRDELLGMTSAVPHADFGLVTLFSADNLDEESPFVRRYDLAARTLTDLYTSPDSFYIRIGAAPGAIALFGLRGAYLQVIQRGPDDFVACEERELALAGGIRNSLQVGRKVFMIERVSGQNNVLYVSSTISE